MINFLCTVLLTVVALEHNEQGACLISSVSVCCYVITNNYCLFYFKDVDSFEVTLTHTHLNALIYVPRNVTCLFPVSYCVSNREHPIVL
jgi:hypothetical protein